MEAGNLEDEFPDYVMVDRTDAQEHESRQIKIWLKPTDSDSPASEYRKHLHSHAPGTGEWVFETEQYRDWSQSDSVGNLWIRGIPGCGKSVVAATITSRLQHLDEPPVPVLFFFFREIIQTNRTPQSLVQDFCQKLIDHSPLLQASLTNLRNNFADEVPFDKLWEALAAAMRAMRKVYCVVDALDEMEHGHDGWLESFLNLGRNFPRSIKTIVTSRQVPHVEKHMFKSHLVDLRLDRRRVDRDISIYVSNRLENAQLGLSESDIEIVKEAICERGNGLFLYARLMLDELMRNPEDLQSRVHNLPRGLGDMYSDILHEHATRSGISSDLQRLILEWITHSARPLRLLELAAMIDALPERKYFGPDVKLAIQTSCGPLLEVCEDGVIQIVHHSLTEFLLNRDVEHIEMTNRNREFAIIDSQAVHRRIARTCINYLTSGCLQQWKLTRDHEDHEPRERQSLFLQFYFLRYTALEWPFHVAKAGNDTELLEKLSEFCRDGNHDFEAWNDIWRACQGENLPRRFSAIHVAAYTGLLNWAQFLLSHGVDPDSKDGQEVDSKDGWRFIWQNEHPRTPLMYAVMKDHHEIVSLLLKHNASHDLQINLGKYSKEWHSMMYYACKLNNVQALRALLTGGVNPMAKEGSLYMGEGDQYCEILGKTVHYSECSQISAIGCACQQGNIEALREIMKHVSPADLCAGNLHVGARAGKAEAVAALLENEHVLSTINDRDSNGNTPLYLAARLRSVPTIRVLLEHGADINVRSLNSNSPPEPPRGEDRRFNLVIPPSYTPLHGWAIGFAREDMEFVEKQDIIGALELLLQAGCDINAKDYRGCTPLFAWPHLHWADMMPDKFVTTLLDRGADATVVNDAGETPLHKPHRSPWDRMVAKLVNAGLDINAQRKKDGLTALMCNALVQNHTDPAVFHELNADFALQDCNGNTALHHYFLRSPPGNPVHLERWFSLSNLEMRNNLGRMPFHEFMYRRRGWVNSNRRFGRVDMTKEEHQPWLEMVKRGVSLESKDGLGRTALLIALIGSNESTLQFAEDLLRLGANVHAVDYRGKSALHYAFTPFCKHWVRDDETVDVARCLVKAGARVDAVDLEGNTIFHDMIGHEQSGLYDGWEYIKDRASRAIEMGVPYHQANYKGRTALHVAAAIENDPGYTTRSGIAMTRLEYLLQLTKPFDVNAKDHEGVTPLHVAAAVSDTNSQILIEHGAEIQAKDCCSRSPLHFAAGAGQSNVVGLLSDMYRQQAIDIDQQCAEGRSALHLAARSGNSEAVRLLLQAGANPSLEDERGRTPLHAAAEFEFRTHTQRVQLAKTTIGSSGPELGKVIKGVRKDAFSCMDVVVSDEDDARCIQEVIQLLLSAGANPGHMDVNRHRAVDVAVMLGCSPAIDELRHSSQDLKSQALDPVGESLSTITELRMREIVDSTEVPEDTRFLERVFSTGNVRLAEAFVQKQPASLAEDAKKSPLYLLARWGFTSMMKKVLPYVEDPGAWIPSLLEHASKRSLSNLAMIDLLLKYLPENLPENSGKVLSNLLAKFASGRRWWHPHALSLLLEAGADPKVALEGEHNPLSISLSPYKGHADANYRYKWNNETLDILLKHGASPNGVPGKGTPPLAAAIEGSCSMETIQLLLSHGAEVNPKDLSLVSLAITSENFMALEVLLKAGADPNSAEEDRNLPLLHASQQILRKQGDTAICLLLQYGADPLRSIKDGSSTLLHKLCSRNWPIRPFLERGIDLSITDSEGCTPLIKACKSYYPDRDRSVAIDMIEAGADVHAVDHAGSSALHYASMCGAVDIIQDLLSKSALISLCNHEGYTPLTLALKNYPIARQKSKKGICAAINYLLDVGADPLSKLPDGQTALHCVAELLMDYSNKDREWQIKEDEGEDYFTAATQLYERFLAAGCDREARDNEGNTPIFSYVSAPKTYSGRDYAECAAERPSNPEDIKKMFSEHDVHKINHNGDSLLHAIARRQKWLCDADQGESLFSMLVDLGLSPLKENNSGQTALDIAAAHEKPEILALFARDE